MGSALTRSAGPAAAAGVPVSKRSIVIVLATFNGARYLRDQVRSIQDQTVTNWRMLVRDDGSSDDSLRLIRDLAGSDPRIEVLGLLPRQRLGVVRNFNLLLEQAFARGAEAVFLADQDDVWLPDKIERQLRLLDAAQCRHGSDVPLLIHSDLHVVDKDAEPFRRSFFQLRGLAHVDDDPLRGLMAQNFVTGATVLVNRRLLGLALPVPAEAVLHDWWLALCAATWGRLEFDPVPTVLYRQHGSNLVGAGISSIPAALRRSRGNFRRGFGQADALLRRVRSHDTASPVRSAPDLLEGYVALRHRRRWSRLRSFWRAGVIRRGYGAWLLYQLWLLLERRQQA